MLSASPIAYARSEPGWTASDRVHAVRVRVTSVEPVPISFALYEFSPGAGISQGIPVGFIFSCFRSVACHSISDLCFSQFITRVCPPIQWPFGKLSELSLANPFLLVYAHNGRQVFPDVEASLKNKPWRQVSWQALGHLERHIAFPYRTTAFIPVRSYSYTCFSLDTVNGSH